jgi:zinc/manganese transport system substrate-binding protein
MGNGKRFFWLITILLTGAAWSPPTYALLNVFACEPEWGALVQELGGDKTTVYVATTARQDPHRIEARPSLIARMRRADLVVCTGAELEIGWLPVLLREAGNGKVQPGRPGYFEAASTVTLMEKPTRLDRAAGDIHSGGNPHIQGDPRNIPPVAESLARALAGVDPDNASHYQLRLADFKARWAEAMARWAAQAASLKGLAIVQQHKDPYLVKWLALKSLGELETIPGVEPTASHLAELLALLRTNPARMILRPAYFSPRPSEWLAERAHIPVVALPFTVGGTPQAKDLFGLYEDTLNRILEAAK